MFIFYLFSYHYQHLTQHGEKWDDSAKFGRKVSFYIAIYHLHLISGMATSLEPRHTVAFILLKLSRATLDLSGARDLVAFCFSISFFPLAWVERVCMGRAAGI